MANLNSELKMDPNITLRDARHAHQFYTQNAQIFSPKVKFLYHVLFEFRNPAKTPLSDEYKKEIAVLAKRVDLPQYTAQIVTKQQYNRKKHVQTRIDYNDITMIFNDDGFGATRAMFEEYYNYYFKDGNKKNDRGRVVDYEPLDKFNRKVPSYGLDNNVTEPFFNFIKIYQLSHHRWFSYTLINPIATQWGHDTLDYGDGGGIMENKMVINYEGVLYSNGIIDSRGEPAGFTDPETAYDQTPSPLTSS